LGLKECIQNFDYNAVYAQHCGKVSLADFFVIAAEVIMGRTAADYIDDPTDATRKFSPETHLGISRNAFKYGRTTLATCDWNQGLMPNPLDGCNGL
jgi:hypothetical protein